MLFSDWWNEPFQERVSSQEEICIFNPPTQWHSKHGILCLFYLDSNFVLHFFLLLAQNSSPSMHTPQSTTTEGNDALSWETFFSVQCIISSTQHIHSRYSFFKVSWVGIVKRLHHSTAYAHKWRKRNTDTLIHNMKSEIDKQDRADGIAREDIFKATPFERLE